MAAFADGNTFGKFDYNVTLANGQVVTVSFADHHVIPQNAMVDPMTKKRHAYRGAAAGPQGKRVEVV